MISLGLAKTIAHWTPAKPSYAVQYFENSQHFSLTPPGGGAFQVAGQKLGARQLDVATALGKSC